MVRAFYWKAYEDNLTGQSAMVAYNLLLSILPVALLSLFIAGQIVESNALEQSVIRDLRKIFPGSAEHTVANALNRVETSSTSIGIAARVAGSTSKTASMWRQRTRAGRPPPGRRRRAGAARPSPTPAPSRCG